MPCGVCSDACCLLPYIPVPQNRKLVTCFLEFLAFLIFKVLILTLIAEFSHNNTIKYRVGGLKTFGSRITILNLV